MSSASEIFFEHVHSPRNRGILDDADAVGVAGIPGRGAYVVLYLSIENSVVRDVRFQSSGCGATIACASCLTELIRRRPVEWCSTLTSVLLRDAVIGLPPGKEHCSELAADALRNALREWRASK